METSAKVANPISNQQIRKAEDGVARLLYKKRFPREWIERHLPDVMAHAHADFAMRLAAGQEDDTVNLLVVIGYRRAIKVLRSQLSRPPITSIETLFNLADESTPTPEEEAIQHDRQDRVKKAMSHLPQQERELLALHFYEDLSIREAGRHVGWGKSAANRHYHAAEAKLRALFDGDRLAL